MGLENLHGGEVVRGKLQVWWLDGEQWREDGLARHNPTGARLAERFQAVLWPTVGRGWLGDLRRRGGGPIQVLFGEGSCGENGFRENEGEEKRERKKRKGREERERKKEKKREKEEKILIQVCFNFWFGFENPIQYPKY